MLPCSSHLTLRVARTTNYSSLVFVMLVLWAAVITIREAFLVLDCSKHVKPWWPAAIFLPSTEYIIITFFYSCYCTFFQCCSSIILFCRCSIDYLSILEVTKWQFEKMTRSSSSKLTRHFSIKSFSTRLLASLYRCFLCQMTWKTQTCLSLDSKQAFLRGQ